MKDTVTTLSGLATHNPFSLDGDNNLRNIMNGVDADNNVNADTAKIVGGKILLSMNGTLVTNYSFKPSAQAITMASKSSVKIDNDQVQVAPNFYFSDLSSHVITPNLKSYFDTISAHIPQLFSTPHLR